MDWLDLIWPKKCVNCGRLGRYVCSACEVGLWEAEQVCPVCNQPSFYGQTHPRCRQASSLDGLTCMWTYAGVARRIITKAQTKYFDVLRELLITNHQLVSRPELSHLVRFLLQRPTVVAIPVLPSSFRSDHIKIAANLLATRWRLGQQDLLIKRPDMSGKAVFQIKSVPPSKILLVNDIWEENRLILATRILKQAGTRQIWGLVLAR